MFDLIAILDDMGEWSLYQCIGFAFGFSVGVALVEAGVKIGTEFGIVHLLLLVVIVGPGLSAFRLALSWVFGEYPDHWRSEPD